MLRSELFEYAEPVPECGCWVWLGSCDRGGYGQFGKHQKAHRAAYELFIGPIPEGLCVCHHCDTPSCVNPTHLFLGTQRDNMMDAAEKNRLNFQTGGARFPGEDHGRSKLTGKQVLEIRSRYESGEIQGSLAEEFGVTQGHVSGLVLRKTWRHI